MRVVQCTRFRYCRRKVLGNGRAQCSATSVKSSASSLDRFRKGPHTTQETMQDALVPRNMRVSVRGDPSISILIAISSFGSAICAKRSKRSGTSPRGLIIFLRPENRPKLLVILHSACKYFWPLTAPGECRWGVVAANRHSPDRRWWIRIAD